MESSRCKTLVTHEMNKLGLQNITVDVGEVEFEGDISNEKLKLFDSALKNLGLEILVDPSLSKIILAAAPAWPPGDNL